MSKEIQFLVKQSKKGSKKAQMQLYDLHCKAMFAIACRYIKNDEEAKDSMQDGFLKAFMSLDSFIEGTNFSSWLKKIIINTCLDALKKKRLVTISLDDEPIMLTAVEHWNFDTRISKAQILEAIDNLSDKYQIVVKLYLLEGYDHSEISEILNIPIKTSRTQLHRGKIALQKSLKYKEYGT